MGYTIWMIIVWHIWKLRNDIIFNNKVFDSQELFCAIQVKSWAVVREKYKNATFSYSD